jgi:uncharacterized protein
MSAPAKKSIQVKCPQCGGVSLYQKENAFRPFCSERCKLMDLGAWANDEYRIAGASLELPLSGGDGDTNITNSSSGSRTIQ